MKKHRVLPGENLLDICLKNYGSIEAVFELSLFNNLAIGEEPAIGSELLLPEIEAVNADFLTWLEESGVEVSTGSLGVELEPTGIGFDIIGQTNLIT